MRISRRTLLKGLGASVALPYLEAMMPLTWAGRAAEGVNAARKLSPQRLAFFYVPNGVHMPGWTPAATGVQFDLPAILDPLKPFQKDLLVLSGLTCDKARANGDGAGDHARAMSAFLTGSQPRKTAGADIKAGISIDQIAAMNVGKTTRFPSLELGIESGPQAGNCDSGYSCAYSTNLSWRGEAAPMSKEVEPRALFDRLFLDQAQADRVKRDRYRKSILDLVQEDARRLQGRLGATDKRKVDEYLTAVREVEQRVMRAEQRIAMPADAPKVPRPKGIPKDLQEHIRLLSDLLVLAFQGDLTRVATFVFANEGSNRSYRFLDVPEGHHDLSHHGGDKSKLEKIQKINRFHVSQLAYLLNKLRSIPEGDGTLLDQCMILYGSGIGDGNRHNHDELPILLAGKAGGTLKTGRHLRFDKNTPITNLYLAMLDRMAVPLKSFGDSTGKLGLLS